LRLMDKVEKQEPKKSRLTVIKKYWPLLILIFIAALAAFALSYRFKGREPLWMHFFMGLFLCQFAMLKLFHPKDFAEGFQMYDLIAMKSKVYAYLYPFIELILGLGYLSFIFPTLTYVATIVVLGIGAIGVFKALAKGLDVRCACMGTVLDVPLSTVTITEDLSMVVMAAILLFK